jgi:aminopeptidase N
MGRVRAAIELKPRRGEAATKALAEAALGDTFWAVRLEATQSLSEHKNEQSRLAMLEVVKDKDSRVRRAGIQALGSLKDQGLADLYIDMINSDQSYFVVAEAARALGMTGSPKAYDVLRGALDQPSWQQTIRAWALGGLGALKDPRALEFGIKYAAPNNPINVRVAAFQVIAAVGKGKTGALETLVAALKDRSLQIRIAAIESLGALGDAQAITALEVLAKTEDLPGPVKTIVNFTILRLKNANK